MSVKSLQVHVTGCVLGGEYILKYNYLYQLVLVTILTVWRAESSLPGSLWPRLKSVSYRESKSDGLLFPTVLSHLRLFFF